MLNNNSAQYASANFSSPQYSCAHSLKRRRKPRVWEISLLIALCVSLVCGAWAQREQTRLSSKLIRLHVIANSDSEYDQATKLKVRDGVLELLTPALAEVKTVAEAEAIIGERLPELIAAAGDITEAEGTRLAVTASLDTEVYPLRVYDTFSLPAGEYTSLRVILGDGAGKNWWCVVFPPLCAQGAGSDANALKTLSGDDVSLVTGDGEGYVIKFRVLELWGELKARFAQAGKK